MIRAILYWLVLSVVIGAGITVFQQLSGKEKWQLTKIVAYATMCGLLAIVVLAFIVVLF